MEKELERGNLDLFLYTKVASARFFHDLGFYEIARVPDRLVFIENQPDGFRHCLSRFERETQAFLTERAGFGNIVLHASGPYIISNATFPSYFLPDDDAASVGHAELDLRLFAKIAAALSIRRRYVGEEPFSQVTGLYNKVMREKLPELGVECRVIPRLAIAGRAVSASDVRQCVKDGDWQHPCRSSCPRRRTTGSEAMPPRRCLLCGEQAQVCARSRRHSVEDLTERISKMLSAYLHH